MKERIIAPCGIDCFNCELFEENVTEAFKERINQSHNIPKEKISCKGCCDGNLCLFLELRGLSCKTLECSKEKGVKYCFECSNFPCENLMPLADGAVRTPHNMKLYNLCMMKKLGVEAWANQSQQIREIYFNNKLVIGKGGSVE